MRYISPKAAELEKARNAEERFIVEGFKNTSAIYAEALAQGWDYWLLQYVSEVARVKSYFMHPASNGCIPYNSVILFGTNHNLSAANIKSEIEAMSNSFPVSIPTSAVERCKRSAAMATA